MNELARFLTTLQPRRETIVGQVVGVTRATDTGRQARADVRIGGTLNLAVALDAQAPELAPADYVRLENHGSTTLADWRVAGAFGARPLAGMLQFLDTTLVGGFTYGPGDIILGSTGDNAPNWWYDYSEGTWYRRVGQRILGSEEANGRSVWGPLDGMHWVLDPTRNTFSVYNGDKELYVFDGDTAYIQGWQGLGRPLGPGIRWGEIPQLDADGDPVLDASGEVVTRYGWRVIGLNGVPVVSILSGDQNNPDEAYLRIGAAGAENYLEYTPADGLRIVANGMAVDDPVSGTDALNLQTGNVLYAPLASAAPRWRVWCGV